MRRAEIPTVLLVLLGVAGFIPLLGGIGGLGIGRAQQEAPPQEGAPPPDGVPLDEVPEEEELPPDPALEWHAYGSDKLGTKYSSLDQINATNIQNLRIAWRQSAIPAEVRKAVADRQPPNNYQHTPLMVDGLLYMSTGLGTVAALGAATGQVVWFDRPLPRTPGAAPPLGSASRGVAYWSDGTDSRIIAIVGQSMVALNAKSGRRYANFGDRGEVDLTQGYERAITGYRWGSSPLVVGNVIVVGGVPAPAGDILSETQRAIREMPPDDVRGYDVRTGELLWTFHVVPRGGEFGNDTWLNNSWTYSGNSGVWTSISADEELGYVYLPTETASGDYYGGTRPGRNLFAESIVCLDARTGERVWHFQTVHHGLWDYDLPAPPNLVDITVDGRPIRAIAQVTKTAMVFVLDRVTGEPVWPVEERPVAQGDVPGEWYSPTQPFPTRPPPFDQQGVSADDVIDFTPELRQQALDIITQYHFGPLFTPPLRAGTPQGKDGTIYMPGTNGGANWGGAGFDPETGVLYVPSAHNPTLTGLVRSQHPESNIPWVRRSAGIVGGPQGLPDPFKPPYGRLVAIDLNRGEILWSVPNGDGPRDHPALRPLNLPPLGQAGRVGPLVTKSFVFLGEGSNAGAFLPEGAGGRMFRAFDKATGAIAWEMELPAGTSGVPMTYMVNDKQYIVVAIADRDLPAELIALALP